MRACPALMSQISEQENHIEVEVVLSAASFHFSAGLVHCGIGHSHAKREGEGTRGEERRLGFFRRIPERQSCRDGDVFYLSDQQWKRHPVRVQDREWSRPGRADFRDAAHNGWGYPTLRVERSEPGESAVGGGSEC